MDFLNPDVVAKSLYLYPMGGLTFLKHPGILEKRGNSIFLNDHFARNWLVMSLSSTNSRKLVNDHDAAYLSFLLMSKNSLFRIFRHQT